MLILVSGPTGSGKSAFAETLAHRAPGRRLYIATMQPQTEDNFRRIERHRRQRAGLGFETVEAPHSLSSIAGGADCTALLEDVSNLLANVLFETEGTAAQVEREIFALAARCRMLVAVTISGLHDTDYDGETAAYIRALNTLNDALFHAADTVFHLQNGVPVHQKGDGNDLA